MQCDYRDEVRELDGQSEEAAAAALEVTPELRVLVILGRYNSVRTEIQWRGVQRDAMVIFAFTLVGVVFGSIDKIGVWAMITSHPLIYLAVTWLHHDRRIGSLAHYLRHVIEPAMKEYDQLAGLEEHLDTHERARSYKQRYHFSSVMSRLLFPSLQGISLGAGIGLFIHKGSFSLPAVSLVVVAAVLILGSIAFTFAKVKHVRIP